MDAALEFYLERPYLPKISGEKALAKILQKKTQRFYIISRKKYWNRLGEKERSRLTVVFETTNRGKKFVLLSKATP